MTLSLSLPRWLSIAATLLALASPALAQDPVPAGGPYVPTPHAIVERMLNLAKVGPNDHLIDLGSGDGRLAIAAVELHKARRASGIEIDPNLVRQASNQAKIAGVGDRVTFTAADLFTANVSEATVVTLYLLPQILGQVEKKLRKELRPGTRVVSHDYPFPTWGPEEVVRFDSPEKVGISGTARTVLYLYRVPAAK